MSSYTVTLISVSAAASLILILFSGSRYEKIIKSSVYIIVAICAISPVAGLLRNNGISSIENEVQNIENEVRRNTVSSCIREIKSRCYDLIINEFPDANVRNIEVGYKGDAPEELRIMSFDVYVSGVGEVELSEYLKDAMDFDEVNVYAEET